MINLQNHYNQRYRKTTFINLNLSNGIKISNGGPNFITSFAPNIIQAHENIKIQNRIILLIMD